MHEQYIANLYANTNAIGSCFGGKSYKPIDPFDNNSNNKGSDSTMNKNSAEYVSFLNAFGIDAKDVNNMDKAKVDDNWDNLSTEEKRKLLFK